MTLFRDLQRISRGEVVVDPYEDDENDVPPAQRADTSRLATERAAWAEPLDDDDTESDW